VRIDLNRPMPEILAELTKHPVKTRLSLTGPLVVARDIAHAKIKERLDAGEEMPQYLKDHPVYYAGPAKTPEGYAVGLVRPDDRRPDGLLCRPVPGRGRLDGHARQGQPQPAGDRCLQGARRVLPRLDRRPGARAWPRTASSSVEVLEYPELGMEAVWKIEVEDFPAFIVVDDKGNDFFAELQEEARELAQRALRLSSPAGAGSVVQEREAPCVIRMVASRPNVIPIVAIWPQLV
jgi:fumarate hydratase class I